MIWFEHSFRFMNGAENLVLYFPFIISSGRLAPWMDVLGRGLIGE
jgi:hypothetical protein